MEATYKEILGRAGSYLLRLVVILILVSCVGALGDLYFDKLEGPAGAGTEPVLLNEGETLTQRLPLDEGDTLTSLSVQLATYAGAARGEVRASIVDADGNVMAWSADYAEDLEAAATAADSDASNAASDDAAADAATAMIGAADTDGRRAAWTIDLSTAADNAFFVLNFPEYTYIENVNGLYLQLENVSGSDFAVYTREASAEAAPVTVLSWLSGRAAGAGTTSDNDTTSVADDNAADNEADDTATAAVDTAANTDADAASADATSTTSNEDADAPTATFTAASSMELACRYTYSDASGYAMTHRLQALLVIVGILILIAYEVSRRIRVNRAELIERYEHSAAGRMSPIRMQLPTWPVGGASLMPLTLVLICVLYFLIFPVGEAADEDDHFYRAFEISCGNLLSMKDMPEDGRILENVQYEGGGDYLPAAVTRYQDAQAELDWSDMIFVPFPNTALYSPVSYLPQALGIKIARLFTNRVQIMFIAGRLSSMIVVLLLSLWALYRMPFGKELLWLVLMIPMGIQEMSTLAVDGLTTALVLVFFAEVLHITYEETQVKVRHVLFLTVVGIWLSQCKMIYVITLLAILIIPAYKYRYEWMAGVMRSGLIGGCLLLNLAWMHISMDYLVPFKEDVDSEKQISYVLGHILEFYRTCARTLMSRGGKWLGNMLGDSMGALNIETNWVVWAIYLVLLIGTAVQIRTLVRVHRSDIIWCVLIALGGFGLILCSEYATWTVYRARIIGGVQGRYFIPLLIYVLLIPLYKSARPEIIPDNADMRRSLRTGIKARRVNEERHAGEERRAEQERAAERRAGEQRTGERTNQERAARREAEYEAERVSRIRSAADNYSDNIYEEMYSSASTPQSRMQLWTYGPGPLLYYLPVCLGTVALLGVVAYMTQKGLV